MSAAPALVCAIAVAGLLLAKWRGAHAAAGAVKAIASGSFIWAGVAWGALETSAGRFVFAGLVLCALGDVLLIAPGAGRAFLAGVGAFALGHIAYALACFALGIDARALAIAALVAIPLLAATWRWLGPRTGRLRAPVGAYGITVAAMAALACAATAQGAPVVLALGGVAFALSDLSVARERFVAPSFGGVAWGLPLYFAAQLAIAASVATH